jgi:hypothetical protein
MKTQETLEIRDLTITEVDAVTGGWLKTVGKLAYSAATALLAEANHNGGAGTISMGELLRRHGY